MNKGILKFSVNRKWIHGLIWLSSIAFFLFAPQIHANIFVSDGKPKTKKLLINKISNDLKFSVDNIEIYDEREFIYNLKGWAFSFNDPELSSSSYDVEIILFTENDYYLFSTRQQSRKDVARKFKELKSGIEMSGFSALINKNLIPPGNYCIGINIFNTIADTNEFIITTKSFVRTPNRIKLENVKNNQCEKYFYNKN